MSGWLHRAIVSLPVELCPRHDTFSDRIVFFETPRHDTPRTAYLQQFLAQVWHVAPEVLDQCIYNVSTEYEILSGESGLGETKLGDLCLLATGCGGTRGDGYAVGADRVHYATVADIDLFVSPRNAVRIHKALQTIELMRNQDERNAEGLTALIPDLRYELLAAEVATKLDGAGPILKLTMRRPFGAYAEEILVDASHLRRSTLLALKKAGVETVRRARRASTPGAVA